MDISSITLLFMDASQPEALVQASHPSKSPSCIQISDGYPVETLLSIHISYLSLCPLVQAWSLIPLQDLLFIQTSYLGKALLYTDSLFIPTIPSCTDITGIHLLPSCASMVGFPNKRPEGDRDRVSSSTTLRPDRRYSPTSQPHQKRNLTMMFLSGATHADRRRCRDSSNNAIAYGFTRSRSPSRRRQR